jgi:ribosome-associated protein
MGDNRLSMTSTEGHQQVRKLVQVAAQICEEKKGADTRILELDAADSGLSDFFLITSATNDRQAMAIADEIEGRLKKEFGVFPNSVEGRRKGDWILLDYVDFVVHIFLAERRAFYDIERLRKSARPLSPTEFDDELKAALAAETRAAREKASATRAKAGKESGAKPAVKRNAAAKKATKTVTTRAKRAAKAAPKADRPA